MRKHMLLALLTALCLTTTAPPAAHATPVPPPKPEPAYAKWGRLAVTKTKERYPQADIVDYRHVGRTAISATESQETFKLWLKQGAREFGVIVRITFTKSTEQVTNIAFQETTR